jgi:uncharacterized LabA/DUF88 family protein
MSSNKLPQKTYVFIDVSNIIYGAKRTGNWEVSYKKLYRYLTSRYKASKIFFYAGVKSLKQNKFVKLGKYGYILRLKELRIYKRKPLRKNIVCPKCGCSFEKMIYRSPEQKANCDVDLTFDAMRYISDYSKMILMSGDGDFYPLIDFLIKKSREVRVIGEARSTATSIKKIIGENFIDLISIKHIIKK